MNTMHFKYQLMQRKIFKLLLLLVIVSFKLSTAQQNNHMLKPNATGYAPVNGLKMYYEIYGNGSMPLVLIHGGGSTIETSFSNLLPLLHSNHKIIAVELQAHGRTSDRDAPESFQQDADDVAALLNYLKIEKANFLGFSNGGSTTLKIAINHSNIVNKIIVVAAVYRRDGLIPGFFEGMNQANLGNMPEPLKVGYAKVAPDKDKLQVMFEKDKQRMINFKDWPDSDIQSIKVPALVVVGDHDVITVEHTLKIAQLISNAQLAVLPGIHGACIGEICVTKEGSKLPEITANLIDAFLKE